MRAHDHDHQDAVGDRTASPRRTPHPAEALGALAAGRPAAVSSAGMATLQRAAGNASVSRLLDEEQAQERSPVLDVVGSGGAPLDKDTRHDMEARLGADFSDVRVHTDATAAASAKSVQARAYTVGDDIVFDSGQYAPDTDHGRHTLAHELTHVVQQRSGPVAGTPQADGISVSDPGDTFERAAEQTAAAALAGPAPVQRQEAPEEEDEGPAM